MEKRVRSFLNKKWKKVSSELESIPYPIDGYEAERKFAYALGQLDLIIELCASAGIVNPHMKEKVLEDGK